MLFRFKKVIVLFIISATVWGVVSLKIAGETTSLTTESNNNCKSCHGGIEHIRAPESKMSEEILKIAAKADFKGNDCIVCHGGNPNSKDKTEAHTGSIIYFKEGKGPKTFYPDPGSPWINENTCGMCHQEQVSTQFTSLMFTEAGKIQGSLWGFGGLNGYKHDVGNYDVQQKNVHEILGTPTYKSYIKKLKELEPNVFPEKMRALPAAPTAEEVAKDPKLAVYTYLRQECQRCHTGNKGRSKRGDFRGIGCSSCHIPYSNEGKYEGNDLSIDRNEVGHMLVHSIQSTREVKVKVHEKNYSGIPVETCTTCHDRGKRIGTSFQGLMETSYSSPFMGDGGEQEKLHTKHYLHLHADLHKDKGMLCQDCHTSIDVHSDGTLAGTTLAPVEIECEDCHGTPEKYPWELPIGYGDEVNGEVPAKGNERGTVKELAAYLMQATIYDKQDGYLLTTRGNPFGNVVRFNDEVIVHTAGGKDLKLKPLKKINLEDSLTTEGRVAMVGIPNHIDKMECYACHSVWAPQCYGCHVKIDYSGDKQNVDWLAMGAAHDEAGLPAEARGEEKNFMIDGKVSEQRSYLRWENPPLVVNGENRISPAIPGCQTTVTVIGKDGKALLLNHIFKIPNVEGAGDEGQLGIDISPVQPHTVSKASRTCESCHTNPIAMGYGIEGGTIYENPSKPYNVDLADAEGNVLPQNTSGQIGSISNLEMDWSRFVDENGKQLQTVGHHFKSSRPLNNEERAKLDRQGVCASCHKEIPEGDLAIDLLSHVNKYMDNKIDKQEHNSLLTKIIKLGAWFQVVIVSFVLLLLFFVVRKWFWKKK